MQDPGRPKSIDRLGQQSAAPRPGADSTKLRDRLKAAQSNKAKQRSAFP